jgi:drug/metabolite transporter (DMT)-like permease
MSTTQDQIDRSALIQGLGLGLVGVLIFGLTLPATRLAVLELDPLFVALGRAILAAAGAAVALIVARPKSPERSDWPRLALFALCVVLGFPLLMTVAIRSAPAAHGGVVLGVMPLLTAMASVVVAGERPSRGFWACGIAGSAAVVAYALISAKGETGLHAADGLLVLAAIVGSLGYVLGGELTRRLGGWEVISWALVFAAPVMLLLLVLAAPPVNWAASPRAWGGFVYVALFSQFLGFFAWNKGLALGGIARVGQTQLLQTFVTLGGAALVLGERIGLLELGFAALIVVLVAAGSSMRVRRSG